MLIIYASRIYGPLLCVALGALPRGQLDKIVHCTRVVRVVEHSEISVLRTLTARHVAVALLLVHQRLAVQLCAATRTVVLGDHSPAAHYYCVLRAAVLVVRAGSCASKHSVVNDVIINIWVLRLLLQGYDGNSSK